MHKGVNAGRFRKPVCPAEGVLSNLQSHFTERLDRSLRGAGVVIASAAVDGAAKGGCHRSCARGLHAHRRRVPVYNISVDEFLNWERHIDRNGVPGCGPLDTRFIATPMLLIRS